MIMKTSSGTQRKAGVASIVLAMALVSGTLAFSAPARSDGGTPIGDQGIEARRQNEIMKHNGGAPQPQVNQYNRGSRGDYHGNNQSRGNYQSRNNDRHHYDDHRNYSRNYHYTPRYTPRYDSYYGYAEPYAYAPYDTYQSPGISLFFNF